MRRKNRNERKMTGKGGFRRGALAVFAAAALMWCRPFVSLADVTGTVKVESAKIRGSADTSSAAVGSVTRGKSVSIKSETTDASGALWYEIYVNATTTGYVRADLIERDGSEKLPSSAGASESAGQTDASQGGGQEASGVSAQAETPMDAQYAKVTVPTAKIRTEPSTSVGVVDSLTNGTEMVVSGQSNGSDGKVWYFVTFTATDGSSKTGFIRSDLIELGDMVPAPEEQPAPEEEAAPEQPQETVSQDYEVVFADGEWHLLDHPGNGDYKIQELISNSQQQSATAEEDTKKLVRQRIAIVVLGVLAGVLLIVVIIMAIKLRDAYYEDYDEDDEEEDDEDEDDDEEEMPVRRRRRGQEDEEENERSSRRNTRDTGPVSRRGVQNTDTAPRRPVRGAEMRGEQSADQRRPASQRKAKNFMLDDDDFEFEFLNMEDK